MAQNLEQMLLRGVLLLVLLVLLLPGLLQDAVPFRRLLVLLPGPPAAAALVWLLLPPSAAVVWQEGAGGGQRRRRGQGRGQGGRGQGGRGGCCLGRCLVCLFGGRPAAAPLLLLLGALLRPFLLLGGSGYRRRRPPSPRREVYLGVFVRRHPLPRRGGRRLRPRQGPRRCLRPSRTGSTSARSPPHFSLAPHPGQMHRHMSLGGCSSSGSGSRDNSGSSLLLPGQLGPMPPQPMDRPVQLRLQPAPPTGQRT
mmetsp:Transcript_24042/g.69091  ORF Transcript_24042/g.69091 Transcript_24042/m.69091 type:complete len:252 (-) Transcript_24042:324-1079(-)